LVGQRDGRQPDMQGLSPEARKMMERMGALARGGRPTEPPVGAPADPRNANEVKQ
jgi:hypothetical protein